MDDELIVRISRKDFDDIAKTAKLDGVQRSNLWNLLNEYEKNKNKSELIQKLIVPMKAIKLSNGKIVIDKTQLKDLTPLFVFINNKSGGQQGKEVCNILKKILNPDQIFDLIADKGPQRGLEILRDIPNVRVLICGGDGTIGWYLNTLDALDYKVQPPIAILPLGTGNDLARALGWGPGYSGENLVKFLEKVALAQETQLDRWNIEIPNVQTPSNYNDSVQPKRIMNNYISFGLDARISMRFHEEREAHPEKFDSRMGNKFQYFLLGNKSLFEKFPKLHQFAKLTCVILDSDGKEVTADIPIPTSCESLMFLNIPSFMAGANPWGTHGTSKKWRPQRIADQLFEIVSVSGMTELAMIKAGLQHGKRIAQARSAVLQLSSELEVEMDGEPWKQPAGSTIKVTHIEKANVLKYD
jgi:diacylglycerol kinase (ATP)